uniref:Uncharacterized protein n=1 Tax=Anabas testudineus TaxID=64144 RepID=A0AAQ6IIF5_ANATE
MFNPVSNKSCTSHTDGKQERSGKVSGLEVEEFLLLYSYKQCFILVWSCFSYKCVIFLWGSFSCNMITI